jgi:hypothetical protein
MKTVGKLDCQFYHHFMSSFLCCATSLHKHFGFIIFWQNYIGTKAAPKMLVKLTAGVNFINIL